MMLGNLEANFQLFNFFSGPGRFFVNFRNLFLLKLMFYKFRHLCSPIVYFTGWCHMTMIPPPPSQDMGLHCIPWPWSWSPNMRPQCTAIPAVAPLDRGPHCKVTLPTLHKTSLYRDPPSAPAPTLAQAPLATKTGDLFKLVHLRTPFCWHLVAAKVHTVSKWVVHILLECFLF